MLSIKETGTIAANGPTSADARNRNDDGSQDNGRQNGPTQGQPARGGLDDTHTTPDQLISRATLKYVGFTEAKADRIWKNWNDWVATIPKHEADPNSNWLQKAFLNCMTMSMEAIDTRIDDDDIWRAIMTAYGLGEQIQKAIMDPLFKPIRAAESCSFWARDAVETRYNHLRKTLRDEGAASPGQEARDESDGEGPVLGMGLHEAWRELD